MKVEDIEYTVDGRRMVGHLAVDEARPGRRPAVLVAHEGPGLTTLPRTGPSGTPPSATSPSPSTTTVMGSRYPSRT